MNSTVEQLKKSPIMEFILDIDCDLPIVQDLIGLEETAKNYFSSSYPKLRKKLLQKFEITAKPETSPQTTIRPQLVQAYQFFKADEKQLIQLRNEGYSFNKLEPYTTLSDYLPEIETTWNNYRTFASPLQVSAVRLRYINRIMLPMVNGKCDLDKYLVSAPHLPDEGRLALTGFIAHRTAVEVDTGHDVNIILAAQKPETDKLPIILDICCAALEVGDPANWSWLYKKIMILHDLSNAIFRKSVKNPCLNLFR